MIWLKAFGITLAIALVVNICVEVTIFAVLVAKSWPEPFQIFISVAAVILSTLIWKKILDNQ